MEKLNHPNVKVTPIAWVDHVKYNQLVAVKGHKNYYVNLISGKLTYKKGAGKAIRTPFQTIMAAQRFVKTQHLITGGQSQSQAHRTVRGVVNPSLEDCWRDLMDLKSKEVVKRTMHNYRNSWDYAIEPFWRDKNISDLNPVNILQFKGWYLDTFPERNAEKMVIHFGMLTRYLTKIGAIKHIDISDLEKIHEIIKRNTNAEPAGKVLSESQLQSLLSGADRLKQSRLKDDKETTPHHRQMLASRIKTGILLAGRLGMRKGEVISLKKKHIDFEKRLIRRWSQKNMKWRDIPLIDEVVRALKTQKKFSGDSEWLFPMPSDPTRHVSSQVFDKGWVHAKNAVDIECRFHDLRHTVATLMGESSFPVAMACEILDMSIRVFEKTYCKPSNAAKGEWMNRLYATETHQPLPNQFEKQFDNRSTNGGENP